MPFSLTERCQFRLDNPPPRDKTTMNLSGTVVPYKNTEDLESMIALLNMHPTITELELQECKLHDHHIKLLAEKLDYIEKINLRGNYITTAGLKLFLEMLWQKEEPKIKKIDLRNSDFSGDEKKWNEIINLIPPTLVELNLDGNRDILGTIKDKVYAKIQENIAKLQLPAGQKTDLSTSSQSPNFFRYASDQKSSTQKSTSPKLTENHSLNEVLKSEEVFFSKLKNLTESQQLAVLEKFSKDLASLGKDLHQFKI